MERKGLSQECLKLLACIAMLLDHLGATVVINLFYRNPSDALLELYEALRLIGRLAFPIYCFLLAEGSFHTRNPMRYGLRLALCALLSELPYDFALRGGIDWQHQNVMVTLFLGFCAMEAMKRCPKCIWKLVAAVPFAIAAEFAGGDYGAEGLALVVLFALTRDMTRKRILQFFGMWFIFSPNHAMMLNWVGKFAVTVQEWAVLALIPIHAYSGKKRTSNKAVQWGFYLFYPLHLLVLCWIVRL